MWKTIVSVMVFGVAAAAGATERPALRDREAPRATDLLRAEHEAQRVGRRLRRPNTGVHGWVRGGSGWTSATEVTEERSDVIINLRTPRRR
jgi:hypothetical protein